METIEVNEWKLLVDRNATSEAYGSIKMGGADGCGCDWCRNWRKAREEHLPASLKTLFDSLGIDATKDVEVYELDSSKEDVAYGGWFAFVGRVARGPGPQESDRDIGGTATVTFKSECDLCPEAFDGHEVASVNFFVTLPWVIAKRKLP